jgi:hypothetical protein
MDIPILMKMKEIRNWLVSLLLTIIKYLDNTETNCDLISKRNSRVHELGE